MTQIFHQRLLMSLTGTDSGGSYVFRVLAMFLAGTWALRSGSSSVVNDQADHLAIPRLVRRHAGPDCGGVLGGFWRRAALGHADGHAVVAPAHAHRLLTVSMGLAYAASCCSSSRRRAVRVLAPLVSAGRMALDVRHNQSCALLFYSFGLRWYGRVGYTGMLAITLSIFAVEWRRTVIG